MGVTINRESSTTSQTLNSDSRVKPRMYVRRSTMYEKAAFLVRKISCVACGFSFIKIHYSVNRINEVYVFSIKYRYSDILLEKI